MKSNLKLLNLVVILLSFIQLSCSLTPPNAEVCLTLPSHSGYCNYTLEDRERLIPEVIWENMQVGRISMSAEDFGKYQTFVEQACEVATCTQEQKDSQKKILNKMRQLNDKFSSENN